MRACAWFDLGKTLDSLNAEGWFSIWASETYWRNAFHEPIHSTALLLFLMFIHCIALWFHSRHMFLFYLETKYLNYWTPLKTTETSESMMLETLVKLYENVKDVPETAALNLNSKRPNVMCLETKRNQTSAAVWLNISNINLLPLLGSFVRGALLVKSGSMWSTVSVFCFVWSPEDYHECHKLLFLKQLALFFFFTLKCIFYIKACLICLAFFFTCVSHI